MAFQIVNDLIPRADLEEMYPLGPEHHLDEHRTATQNILSGKDKRMLVVVGPCSAWSPDAVYEYADHLTELSAEVRERLFIVMRLVLVKPRTTSGWEGVMIQPNPFEPPNIREGVRISREMLHRVGKQLPLADEMVNTENAQTFGEPFSYIWIGARTTLSPQHRKAGSGLENPVGIKNPVSGNIGQGVDGVQVVQEPHHFFANGKHMKTSGNPYAHLILRGGEKGVNYDPASIAHAHRELTAEKRRIQNPAIMVDTSHDNCKNGTGRDANLQPMVMKAVMLGIEGQREEYQNVRGFLTESFLQGGNQKIQGCPDQLVYGQSLTDPCLSFPDTERALHDLAESVDRARFGNHS